VIENQTLAFDQIEENETYQNCHFTFSNRLIRLMDVTLIKCTFDQQDFSTGEFVDCQWINCELANTNFANCVFYDNRFATCLLTGVDFSNNDWKQVVVEACKTDYFKVSGSRLTNCQFNHSHMIASYFQEVIVKKGLVFDHSEIDQTDFTGTAMTGINLADSQFSDLMVTPALLRGCKINAYQAALFVALIGMEVVD
jgi:uncharacterized protein YjbI with pentapeptide repeats